MYRCESCRRVAAPGVPCARKVVKTRSVFYPVRYEVQRPRPGKSKFTDDPGGTGWETVRELKVCPACSHGGSPPLTS
jgi:hypothetical protein